ncbi:MAG: Hpt domain-containing protein [Devosia sp.]|uniref:Hpt domain-containing protein n=1 Tax=Devosia sp. TaxID=1871048 RepID=UPI0024C60FDF|nr:Hpt domain-containing protein [Devosia sp.]UYO00707.1 MAG: Hpt domain-containing protein [Devosia sp.]
MAQTAVKAPIVLPRTRPMRPVDLVHLAKQCLGDENLELEVLRLFDQTLFTYFGRLRLALSFDDLAINVHSIKGAASGVGAWTISEIARAMEDDLRAGRPLRSEAIDDLGLAVEEVRDFIARMLADQAE